MAEKRPGFTGALVNGTGGSPANLRPMSTPDEPDRGKEAPEPEPSRTEEARGIVEEYALGRHAGRVDRILHGERNAMQRAELLTREGRGLSRLRSFQRIVSHRDDRVDLRVHSRDAIEVRLHDLDRRDLLGPDQFGQPGCVGEDEVVAVRRRMATAA